MRSPTFEQVAISAEIPGKNWSASSLAKFHYFNENGLNHKKKESDKKVSEFVAKNGCKSGAIIAYGTFNDFNTNELRRIACMKRVSKIELMIVISGIRKDIESARNFMDNHK